MMVNLTSSEVITLDIIEEMVFFCLHISKTLPNHHFPPLLHILKTYLPIKQPLLLSRVMLSLKNMILDNSYRIR
jgi:hypothetical protein